MKNRPQAIMHSAHSFVRKHKTEIITIAGIALFGAAAVNAYKNWHLVEERREAYIDAEGDYNRRINQSTVHIEGADLIAPTPEVEQNDGLAKYFEHLEEKEKAGTITIEEKECLETYIRLKALEELKSEKVGEVRRQIAECI